MRSKESLSVEKALIDNQIETPMLKKDSNPEKLFQLEHHFSQILNLLNLDLTDDSLQDTPKRLSKMYANELFYGMDYNNFPKITLINSFNDDIVICKKIRLTSTCEHHFAPITGYANIAYYPNKTIIGLSKLNRIVDFFARRPQVQERLTKQILVALKEILQTENVGVYIEASHGCVKTRGILDQESLTSTISLSGILKEKEEFYYNFLK
ncbi:MAG: GTP cyclohydrolase I FolE [Psittacicella sp.]